MAGSFEEDFKAACADSDLVRERLYELAGEIESDLKKIVAARHNRYDVGWLRKGIRLIPRRGSDGLPWYVVRYPAGSLMGARKLTRLQVYAWGHRVDKLHKADDFTLAEIGQAYETTNVWG